MSFAYAIMASCVRQRPSLYYVVYHHDDDDDTQSTTRTCSSICMQQTQKPTALQFSSWHHVRVSR